MSAEDKIQRVCEARRNAMGETRARKRISLLLDDDSFVEIDGFVLAGGAPSGVVCGYGSVLGSPVAVFAQDRDENHGAVGAAHAAKIGKVYDYALKTGIPVVGIYDSHGARIEEGVGALAAYGDMLRDVNNLSGVVPQIALVAGTCAGVSSLLACSSDFVVMTEDAELFLAASEGEDSGTARDAAKAGVAHIVCPDEASACETVRGLLSLLPLNNLSPVPVREYTEPAGAEERLRAACENMESADAVELVASICDEGSVIELLPAFGEAAYTALATMAGYPCGIAATRGRLDSDTCSKIAKLVSVCDAYQIPVLTLVNAEGGASLSGPGLCSSIRDMARMAHVYAEATTPKLAVITGAAYGSTYVALAGRAAGADYTVAWPSAVISPLPPRAAVAFLYGDRITKDRPREQLEAEYIENEASAFSAAVGGYLEDVIDPALTRPALLSALDLLSAKRVSRNPKKHGNVPM